MSIKTFTNYKKALPHFQGLINDAKNQEIQVFIGHYSEAVRHLINSKPWLCDLTINIIANRHTIKNITEKPRQAAKENPDRVKFGLICEVPDLEGVENFIVSQNGFYDELGLKNNHFRVNRNGKSHYMTHFYQKHFANRIQFYRENHPDYFASESEFLAAA